MNLKILTLKKPKPNICCVITEPGWIIAGQDWKHALFLTKIFEMTNTVFDIPRHQRCILRHHLSSRKRYMGCRRTRSATYQGFEIWWRDSALKEIKRYLVSVHGSWQTGNNLNYEQGLRLNISLMCVLFFFLLKYSYRWIYN